jgi:hypothetical protein
MSNPAGQSVIQKLRQFETQLQQLMELLANKSHLSPEEKIRAQEQMKIIKEGLKGEYKRGATASGQAEMNRYEKAYLHPAVHGASTQIRVRWNSDPISSRWFSELYAAHVDISYYLHQLETSEKPS